MNKLFPILFISLFIFSCNKEKNNNFESNQFYGFYQSDKGENYKKFQHNIYGFIKEKERTDFC